MKLFYGQIFPNVEIDKNEQEHITKVLRLSDGETIYITDGKGNLASGTLSIMGKKALLIPEKITENMAPFSPHLHMAIAPTKNMDRIEFFIEKSTELGISEITFLQTDRTERKNINLEKIQKQIISASKQSLRTHFPKINPLTNVRDFILQNSCENTFVAHCNEKFKKIPIHHLEINSKITFMIGPEGDFSPKEIEFLSENKINAITLGNQRLRTETAGIFLCAFIYQKMI